MKAAVIFSRNDLPQYAEMPDPSVEHENEVLVAVKAVAIKHFDKSRAAGTHYSSDQPRGKGKIVGGDGVGMLSDGSRVYGIGISGMLAEMAVIDRNRMVKIPGTLDDATAAALPNAVIGAAMALRFKANIQPGDIVLINGATGFTGRIAVQIAKHYGAKKIIVTGRNPVSLKELLSLGADITISLPGSDEEFKMQLSSLHENEPIDVIVDYLWGHSAEMILDCIKGDGSFTNPIRYVSVGSVTGDTAQISAASFRSVNLQLSGSGLGAWSKEEVGKLFTEILPEMFQLAAGGKLVVSTITVSLPHIADLWNIEVPDGQRLVVMV